MNTEIYLIRHSKANKLKIKRKEGLLKSNKNVRLSKEGKKIIEEFSSQKEFDKFDVVISSDYKRAIETALYLVKNTQEIIINNKFGERIHGVENFKELPHNFEFKQLEDENFKVGFGESQKEVQSRMYKGLIEILEKYKGKKIAIVSHSTAITFLLKKWCEINYEGEYTYNKKVFFDGRWIPCTTFKLTFDEDKNLIDIKNVKRNIKVMSFNLRHIIKEEIFGLWKKRYEKIVNYIQNEDPDIIGVQELTRKGKRYLKRKLKEYKIVGKKRYSIIFTNEYNCVLVKRKFKIKGHKTYSLSDKINILGRKSRHDNFPRICTLVHIEIDNDKYMIANTHIDNSSKENKKRQLDIFDKIVDTHKKEDEYLIITGDFNMTLDNKNLLNYSKKYTDPFKDFTITTFPSNPDLKALDHIFIDKKLTYSEAKIHNHSNDNGFMSDHNPISCKVTII